MTVQMNNHQQMNRMIPEHQLNLFVSVGYGIVTASSKPNNDSSLLQPVPQTGPGTDEALHSIVKTENK